MAAKLVKKHLNASARSKLKHPSMEKDKEQERELKSERVREQVSN